MQSSPSILTIHPYLRQTLSLISDKWVVAVMYALSFKAKRHGELQREIGEVSQRMLTRTLRKMEGNGLIARAVLSDKPLVVEYSLTPLGKTLVEPLKGLCEWAIANFHEVEAIKKSTSNRNS